MIKVFYSMLKNCNFHIAFLYIIFKLSYFVYFLKLFLSSIQWFKKTYNYDISTQLLMRKLGFVELWSPNCVQR